MSVYVRSYDITTDDGMLLYSDKYVMPCKCEIENLNRIVVTRLFVNFIHGVTGRKIGSRTLIKRKIFNIYGK